MSERECELEREVERLRQQVAVLDRIVHPPPPEPEPQAEPRERFYMFSGGGLLEHSAHLSRKMIAERIPEVDWVIAYRVEDVPEGCWVINQYEFLRGSWGGDISEDYRSIRWYQREGDKLHRRYTEKQLAAFKKPLAQ